MLEDEHEIADIVVGPGEFPDRDDADRDEADRDDAAGPVDAEAVTVERCRLTGADLHGWRLAEARLTDVTFDACDLSNLVLDGASLLRVSMVGCRITGLRLVEAGVTDVRIHECRGEGFLVADARLLRVAITSSVLPSADLSGGRWDEVLLSDDDLPELDVTGVRAERTHLRTCTLTGARGLGGLRGMAADPFTRGTLADDLARHAGLLLLLAASEGRPDTDPDDGGT